jgi:hypothetical protein
MYKNAVTPSVKIRRQIRETGIEITGNVLVIGVQNSQKKQVS